MKSSISALTLRDLLPSPAGTWNVSRSLPSSPTSVGTSLQLHIIAKAPGSEEVGLSRQSASLKPPSARNESTSCWPYSAHTFASLTITNLLALMPFFGVSSAAICVSRPWPTCTALLPMTGMIRRSSATAHSCAAAAMVIWRSGGSTATANLEGEVSAPSWQVCLLEYRNAERVVISSMSITITAAPI